MARGTGELTGEIRALGGETFVAVRQGCAFSVGEGGLEPPTSCPQSRRATYCATPRNGPRGPAQRTREPNKRSGDASLLLHRRALPAERCEKPPTRTGENVLALASFRRRGGEGRRRIARSGCCLLTEDSVHLGTAGWADALRRAAPVGQVNFVTVKRALLAALHAVPLVIGHATPPRLPVSSWPG